jgi:hypothetical protein
VKKRHVGFGQGARLSSGCVFARVLCMRGFSA